MLRRVRGNACPSGSLGQMLCSPDQGQMVMVSSSNTGRLSLRPPSTKYCKAEKKENHISSFRVLLNLLSMLRRRRKRMRERVCEVGVKRDSEIERE